MSDKVVISFLGADEYRSCSYNFNGEMIKARYASTAFLSYIRSRLNVYADTLIICGTQSSTWDLLSVYFSEMAESVFGSEAPFETVRDYLESDPVKNANAEIKSFRQAQKLGAGKRNDCDSDKLLMLLENLQNCLNQAFEPVSFKIALLVHGEVMGEYSQQIELLNRIRELDFIDASTQIYLDITNGMRIIPFAVFADFQCLCQLKNLNIRQICYMPEYMPKTEPVSRLDAIEKIKSRLRYLKLHDRQSFDSKFELVKEILKTQRPKPGERPPVEVCFLDGAVKILDNASMISRFNVTADPSCFAGAVSGSKLNKKLNSISFALNMGRYSAAAELIRNGASSVLQSIENIQIKKILSDFFSWTDEMESGDMDRCAQGIKRLCSSYLAAGNYIQAINSCQSSIENYEFRQERSSDKEAAAGKKNNDGKCALYNAINKKYPGISKNSFPWKSLMSYRGMLIHKNDITDDGGKWINDSEKILRKFVYTGKTEGSVSLSKLPNEVRDCMIELGVSKPETVKSARENVLISFIGSGDYAKCNYTYVDPDGSSSSQSYNLKGSRVIGMSLANKISSFSGNQKITKFLICGTKTSNWRIVLYALQQEFGGRFSSDARDELDILIKNIEDNQDYLSVDASVSEELVTWLNTFMSANRHDLGLEIKALMTDDKISGSGVEQELFEMLEGAVGYCSRVSFDITHCYRIIPILVLCIIEYLVTVKKVKIEHIFYGEIPLERDFNILNALKKAQLEDDAAFLDKFEQIEKILSEDREENLLSGSVYDMRNISRLFDYSFMLGQYRATDNPAFLDAIMSSEFKNKDSRVYESFKNGVFLNNFLMLRDSSYFLEDVIIALHKPVQDPVLSVLKGELIECLSSRLPLDDNFEFSTELKTQISFMSTRVRSALERNNYAEALCFCYEAIMYLPEYLYENMRNFGKKSYSLYDNNRKIKFSDKLPADVYSFLHPLENSSGTAKFIKVFTAHGFKETKGDIMLCNNALADLLYESRKELKTAIYRRNNMFHGDGDQENKADLSKCSDETYVRNSVENAIKALEQWIDGH